MHASQRWRGWLLGALALGAGCGGGGDDAEAAPAAETTAGDEGPASDAPPAAASATVNMATHFRDVAAARDALIRGDLDAYRAPLERIADASYGADLPTSWVQWVGEMQAVARQSAQAETIEEAAGAVAELGLRCGQCHRDTNAGPADEGDARPAAAAEATPAEARMRAHAWGTEQMWLGLTAPSYGAWVRGAQAIADPGETRRTPLGASLAGLQEFASRAALANRVQERATMYADILTRCAACHGTHGITPGR